VEAAWWASALEPLVVWRPEWHALWRYAVAAGVILLAVLGVISLLNSGWDFGSRLQRLLPETRSHALTRTREQVERLRPGIQLHAFAAILGGMTETTLRTHGPYTERIYVLPFCYVQAVTDPDNSVMYFSVTARVADFRPTFVTGPEGNYPRMEVRLGETPFSAHPFTPEIIGYLGARSIYYSEIYYFGNPGHYRRFALSLNTAGTSIPSALVELLTNDEIGVDDLTFLSEEQTRNFRATASPNTWTVTAPHFEVPLPSLLFGPDPDQMRVAHYCGTP
jgi:hypothetical protein